MVTFAIVGEGENSSLTAFLIKKLRLSGTVYFIKSASGGTKISCLPALKTSCCESKTEAVNLLPPDYLVLTAKNLKKINVFPCVAIFPNHCSHLAVEYIHPQNVAVVPSDNIQAATLLHDFNIKSVSVGCSSKDTITFSSSTSDSVVVSLQRSLYDLNGHVIEPEDIPVQLQQQENPQDIMLAVSALLLAGKEKFF